MCRCNKLDFVIMIHTQSSGIKHSLCDIISFFSTSCNSGIDGHRTKYQPCRKRYFKPWNSVNDPVIVKLKCSQESLSTTIVFVTSF